MRTALTGEPAGGAAKKGVVLWRRQAKCRPGKRMEKVDATLDRAYVHTISAEKAGRLARTDRPGRIA